MNTDLVKTELRDNLYFVTLNRAEKRNAISIALLTELADAVAGVDAYPGVRAVIVQAEGPIFSAGIDVMALMGEKASAGEQNPARWLRRLAESLQHQLYRIEQTEVPVIGACEGGVYGLGLEMAMAFDLIVAGEGCIFTLPETRLGLVADVGGTTRLTKRVGPSRAKDMLMTARKVGAEEALQWGLVNRLVPDGKAVEGAVTLAQEISKNAPLAVGLAKYVVDHGDGVDRMTQMAIERLAQSQLITAEDTTEALMSMMEKRDPDFKGR